MLMVICRALQALGVVERRRSEFTVTVPLALFDFIYGCSRFCGLLQRVCGHNPDVAFSVSTIDLAFSRIRKRHVDTPLLDSTSIAHHHAPRQRMSRRSHQKP